MSQKSSDRLSEKEARAVGISLSESDRRILLALHACRAATVEQIRQLLSVSRPAVQNRLLHLYQRRFADRIPWRFSYVYFLDTLGEEYVSQATGLEVKPTRLRAASAFFLEHTLAATDVYIALATASERAGLTFSWRNELEAADHYEASGRPKKLEPDALFLLRGTGIRTVLAFLEVDRATESWQKWGKKLRDYSDYFLSGRFLERWQAAPRVAVLVVAPDLRRAEALRTFTADAGRWQAILGGRPIPIGFAPHEAVTPDRVLDFPWAGLDGSTFRLVEEEVQ